MGLFSTSCSNCGSTEHSTGDCPHGIFSNKCRNCGSVDHATSDCPQGIFSSKCRHCGSIEHSTSDCPHGIFSEKCKHCGSVDHATSDCPHGIFSTSCRNCGSRNHSTEDCPQGLFGKKIIPREEKELPSSSSSDENGCSSFIGWIIGVGLIIFAVVWFLIKIAIPVAVLNAAFIFAIIATFAKKGRILFAILSLIGGCYLMFDIYYAGFSSKFVNEIVKNPEWITAFVYINALAIGLSVWFLLQSAWSSSDSALLKFFFVLLILFATACAPVFYYLNNNGRFQKQLVSNNKDVETSSNIVAYSEPAYESTVNNEVVAVKSDETEETNTANLVQETNESVDPTKTGSASFTNMTSATIYLFLKHGIWNKQLGIQSNQYIKLSDLTPGKYQYSCSYYKSSNFSDNDVHGEYMIEPDMTENIDIELPASKWYILSFNQWKEIGISSNKKHVVVAPSKKFMIRFSKEDSEHYGNSYAYLPEGTTTIFLKSEYPDDMEVSIQECLQHE